MGGFAGAFGKLAAGFKGGIAGGGGGGSSKSNDDDEDEKKDRVGGWRIHTGYKRGGKVKRTGMARVHRGERVLTKKQAKKYEKK